MRSELLDNKIFLFSDFDSLIFFAGLGIILLIVGLVTKGRMPQEIKNFLPLCGSAFVFFAVIVALIKPRTTIEINGDTRKVIVLRESGLNAPVRTEFDFRHFTHVEVIPKFNLKSTPRKIARTKDTYVIQFAVNFSTCISLGEYEASDELRDLIDKMSFIFREDYPLYLISSPNHQDANFVKQFKNELNIEIVYDYHQPAMMDLDPDLPPIKLEYPDVPDLEYYINDSLYVLKNEGDEHSNTLLNLSPDSLRLIESLAIIHSKGYDENAVDSLEALNSATETDTVTKSLSSAEIAAQGELSDSMIHIADSIAAVELAQLEMSQMEPTEEDLQQEAENTQASTQTKQVYDVDEEKEDITFELGWHNRKSISKILFFDIVVVICFLFIHLYLIPLKKHIQMILMGYVFMVIVGVIALSITFAMFSTRFEVRMERNNIIYSTKLIGIKAFEQSIPKSEAYYYINTFDSEGDNQLTIYSPKGYEIYLNYQLHSEEDEDFTKKLEKAYLHPNQYVMTIDVSDLSFAERKKIEEEIKKYVREDY